MTEQAKGHPKKSRIHLVDENLQFVRELTDSSDKNFTQVINQLIADARMKHIVEATNESTNTNNNR